MAYSVYSFASQYTDTGMIGVYVGTREENLDACVEIRNRRVGEGGQVGLEDLDGHWQLLDRGNGQRRRAHPAGGRAEDGRAEACSRLKRRSQGAGACRSRAHCATELWAEVESWCAREAGVNRG